MKTKVDWCSKREKVEKTMMIMTYMRNIMVSPAAQQSHASLYIHNHIITI